MTRGFYRHGRKLSLFLFDNRAGGTLTFDEFVGLLAEVTALTNQFRRCAHFVWTRVATCVITIHFPRSLFPYYSATILRAAAVQLSTSRRSFRLCTRLAHESVTRAPLLQEPAPVPSSRLTSRRWLIGVAGTRASTGTRTTGLATGRGQAGAARLC